MQEVIEILRRFGILIVLVVGFVGYVLITLKQKISEARKEKLQRKRERISNLYQRRG